MRDSVQVSKLSVVFAAISVLALFAQPVQAQSLNPTVTNVSPNACLPPNGGTSVTLTGTNLLNGTVTVNGNAVTVTSTTSTTVVFTTPAGTAGSQVNVTVSTAAGIAPASYVYSPPKPTIDLASFGLFCYDGGSLGWLVSSSPSGNQWNLNGTPVPGATDQVYYPAVGGNYSVTVGGCSNATSASVTISPRPTPTITPGGPTEFCVSGNVTLTSSNAFPNQWYLNSAPIDAATNQTYTASTNGSYTVMFTVGACISYVSAPVRVTVHPIPSKPTITSWTGHTRSCGGSGIELRSSGTTFDNQWYLNGSPIIGRREAISSLQWMETTR